MIKILIIEDEQEKRRNIVEAILSVEGISEGDIDHDSDVVAAKRRLTQTRYDLVILDINLPENSVSKPAVGAGLGILNFIKRNAKAQAPKFLVGMSAYDEGFSAATDAFSSPLWKLMRFSYGDSTWQNQLREAVEYIVQNDKPPYLTDGRTFHRDLAIFVALEDVELDSIRALDGHWQEVAVAHDNSRYFEGYFSNGDSYVSVVVVAAPKMGMPTAAAISSKLIYTYRPRYLAITGICAGVKGKVEIGDILVADPCFDWGSGKWVKNPVSGDLRFRPAPYPWRLDDGIRSKIKALSESEKVIEEIRYAFGTAAPRVAPSVKIEAMASGGSVLQAAKLMDDVLDQHKNLVGVEMESYAVFTAAAYAPEPRPVCFSIKSVCDFGDESKTDNAHKYAAHTSAHFLYHFALAHLGTIKSE